MPDAQPWSTAELGRNVVEIKAMLAEIRTEQREQRGEFLHRDVWDEWKQQVALDVVNLEAEAARMRRDHRDDMATIRTGQRWAISLSVSAAGVVIAALVYITNAAGLGA